VKRRILTLTILSAIFLLVISSVTTSLAAQEFRSLKSIEKEKVTSVDKIIANKHVKYVEHVVDDVYIKGDYILTHEDTNGKVTKYEKVWTDVAVEEFDFSDIKVNNIFWKKKVIFPEESDCENFYSFDEPVEYPLGCWEARHEDGTTLLYDSDENIIGKGIPTPSESFIMTGPCYNEEEEAFRDEWFYLKSNAKEWYSKWSNIKSIIYNPHPYNEISPNVEDSDVELFYEVAHGGHDWFSASIETVYTEKDAQNNMSERQPMKFAFIGSCGGMDKTGKDSFSYAFRKGKMQNTVTVGYSGMTQCDGWKYAKYWQDEMFKNIDKGFTIRHSFNLACQAYPTIANATVFCGDEKLTLVDVANNNKSETPVFTNIKSGETGNKYSFDVIANDPDEDPIYYKIDWGDGKKELKGPYTSGEEIRVSHSWKRRGSYTIKVESIDVYGDFAESESSITISGANSMSNSKTKLLELLNFFKNIIESFRENLPKC